MTQIESTRCFILCVHNDHCRSDFAGISKSALERIYLFRQFDIHLNIFNRAGSQS